MKQILIISIAAVIIIGCDVPTGSKSDASINGTGGYWELTECFVNGKPVSPGHLSGKSLLLAQRRTANEKSYLMGSMYRSGYEYVFFSFYDASITLTDSFPTMFWHSDYSKKHSQEVQWHKINDDLGLQIIVELGATPENQRRIQVSNVMRSTNYNATLDTLRLTYVPTMKFK